MGVGQLVSQIDQDRKVGAPVKDIFYMLYDFTVFGRNRVKDHQIERVIFDGNTRGLQGSNFHKAGLGKSGGDS
jgi:hypothetical protein